MMRKAVNEQYNKQENGKVRHQDSEYSKYYSGLNKNLRNFKGLKFQWFLCWMKKRYGFLNA